MYIQRGSTRKRVENRAEFYLPDEIVVNILSRLPAKDVLHCRCVCRRWRDLTSDQDRIFLDLHLKFGVAMILAVDHSIKKLEDPFLLDKWWETASNRSVIQGFGTKYRILFSDTDIQLVASPLNRFLKKYDRFSKRYDPLFSHNGLIVLKQNFCYKECSRNYIIFNPINGENVGINLLSEIPWGDLYGVFFHPLLKQYCTLWGISLTQSKGISLTWSNEVEQVEYRVLNLGSKPCWQKIRNPWNKNPRIQCVAPVFIDKYFYWVVEAAGENRKYKIPSWDSAAVTLNLHIMEFDIVKQELKLMPCPITITAVIQFHSCNINLLNIEGCLSLVQLITHIELILDVRIWTLKDRGQQLWKRSDYRINFHLYPTKFHSRVGALKAICAANGELAIQSHTTILVYNLKSGTIRIMEEKKFSCIVRFFSHLMSFASLKDCKSNIYMDEKGEVDKKEKKSLVVFNSKKEKSYLKFSISKVVR